MNSFDMTEVYEEDKYEKPAKALKSIENIRG